MNKKVISIILLLIIPAMLTYYRLNVDKPHYSSDPEYVYMMNGLNLSLFHLPIYSDHPGVPLTIFNAVFFYPIYLTTGHENGLQQDFIANPLYYELVLHHILFVIVIISSFIGAYFLWKKTKNIALALLLQGVPFYYFLTVDIIATRMLPETIFPIIFIIFFNIIVSVILNPENKKVLLLLPILSGVALSVKIILFPFLLIPLLLYGNTFKKIIYFCLITSLSFIVCTLPIIKQFPHMGYWVIKLFIYSGIYGQGKISVIEPSTYLTNLKLIITIDNLLLLCFFISVIFAIVLPFLRKKYPDFLTKNLTHLFYIVFVTLIINLLIVAKSFEIGKDYYLITHSILIFSCLVFVFISIGKYFSSKFQLIGMLSLIFIILLINHNKYKDCINGWKLSKQDLIEVDNFISKQKNSIFIYHNGYSINKMNSLLIGNVYSKIHNKLLKELYPDAWFFDVVTGKFSIWNGTKNISALLLTKKTYILDFEFSNKEIIKLNNLGISSKVVFKNRTKTIYQIYFDTKVFDGDRQLKYKRLTSSIKENPSWINNIKEISEKQNLPIDSLVNIGAFWLMQ